MQDHRSNGAGLLRPPAQLSRLKRTPHGKITASRTAESPQAPPRRATILRLRCDRAVSRTIEQSQAIRNRVRPVCAARRPTRSQLKSVRHCARSVASQMRCLHTIFPQARPALAAAYCRARFGHSAGESPMADCADEPRTKTREGSRLDRGRPVRASPRSSRCSRARAVQGGPLSPGSLRTAQHQPKCKPVKLGRKTLLLAGDLAVFLASLGAGIVLPPKALYFVSRLARPASRRGETAPPERQAEALC